MRFALVLAFLAPFADAATVRLYGGTRAENHLRRFVSTDPALKARLDDAAKREQLFLAENRETELRDAVSQPENRSRLLERLPGLRRLSGAGCASLADCAVPELALDVPDASTLDDSVRRLVRPWMLLQQARGKGVELTPASSGDAVLSVKLQGLDEEPLVLNVAPRLLGGFKVWYDRPLVLAALYGRERDAILR